MQRLTDEQIDNKIKEAFILEIGLLPLEIGHTFPVAYESCVHTEDRTWYGKLHYTGRHKKGSFIEDK
jgi:hypothetical protein